MKRIDKNSQKAIGFCFLLLALFSTLPSFAQIKNDSISSLPVKNFPTFEGGVFFGAGLIYGDLTSDAGVIAGSTQPAYGIFGIRNFTPNWAVRLNLIHAKLKANDLDSGLAGHRARGFNHKTSLTELSVLAQWDLHGKRRYKRIASFKKTVSPYLYAGIAGGMGKPEVFYDDQKDTPAVLQDKKNTVGFRLAIPVGGGLKFDLSQRSLVTLEFGLRPTFGDLLDGVSESGNPEKNDWYAFGGIAFGYRFATNDADGDGVVDAKDKCPGVAGDKKFRGCPDTDGDGVRDNDDDCPLLVGAKTMNGCPDTDLDGVADAEDECPETKGMRRLQGCPDADWDNVIDKLDACPNTPGLAKFKGCPDTDLDGVMDLEDKCPETPGLIKFSGCPEEKDILEEIAKETTITDLDKNTATLPPSDPIKIKDSVIEQLKKSVEEMPKIQESSQQMKEEIPKKLVESKVVEEKETPTLRQPATIASIEKKESTKKVSLPTFEMIRFATASNELTERDKLILDKIASTLPNFPDTKLQIFGYTDNIGNDILNDKLSEKRAKSCLAYLQNKGVNLQQITVKGFGERNPIATNETDEGRTLNRRVEIFFERIKY